MISPNNKVPAVNFLNTVLVNLDNEKMSDADFRDFIRNTMPIVEKMPLDSIANEELREKSKKYTNEIFYNSSRW